MHPALEFCLTRPPQAVPCEDIAAWWPGHLARAARCASPIERSIVSGFEADRLGWAFAGGYQAALRALVPDLPTDAMAAFCVTEENGNRPRDILTTLTRYPDGRLQIDGQKKWATLGPESTVLLVTGRLLEAGAEPGARPDLRVVRVESRLPGVTLLSMPPTAFVPEVPHARVRLEGVAIDADTLLPGDGYARYVKPFRTLEDTQIAAATMACLLREARARGWPTDWRERCLALLAAFIAIAQSDASDPTTHLSLAGALQWSAALREEARALLDAAPPDAFSLRWRRDAALSSVASGAGRQRTARAWERLAGATG